MKEILKKYIEVDNLFQECRKKQYDGELDYNDLDMQLYYASLRSFIKTAKEYYKNEELELDSVIKLFNSDKELQDELIEYQNNKSKGKNL